ncbi:hypothetical protein IQ22_00047 [Pseudomonas duriflava]|uniref:Uncharacterized protein n=2 Tax=Pseudomonas duriflava TaxID=459528 RepID=A0A562QNV0_9PSED|nr:hypothetical protein IQ22_00047 [Pseudomonas duriflava]
MYIDLNELWHLLEQVIVWAAALLKLGLLFCAVGIVAGLMKWSVWWGKTLTVISLGIAAFLTLGLDFLGSLMT